MSEHSKPGHVQICYLSIQLISKFLEYRMNSGGLVAPHPSAPMHDVAESHCKKQSIADACDRLKPWHHAMWRYAVGINFAPSHDALVDLRSRRLESTFEILLLVLTVDIIAWCGHQICGISVHSCRICTCQCNTCVEDACFCINN
eukprot:6184966-Pleurochrysis_carterae.AAC.1